MFNPVTVYDGETQDFTIGAFTIVKVESAMRSVSGTLAVNNRGSNNARLGVVKVNLAFYGNGRLAITTAEIQVNIVRAGIDPWSNNDHIAIDSIVNGTLNRGIVP
ncbi:hypothetical protein ES703_31442 [subsurface metagenome]